MNRQLVLTDQLKHALLTGKLAGLGGPMIEQDGRLTHLRFDGVRIENRAGILWLHILFGELEIGSWELTVCPPGDTVTVQGAALSGSVPVFVT